MIAVQATNYLNALPQNEQQFIGYFQCNIIFRVKDVLKKSFRDKGLKEEPGDLMTQFGGQGRKIFRPYPTTARGLRCCFQTP